MGWVAGGKIVILPVLWWCQCKSAATYKDEAYGSVKRVVNQMMDELTKVDCFKLIFPMQVTITDYACACH